jgi:dihydroorotate dehydrogenase electron transfer subunit
MSAAAERPLAPFGRRLLKVAGVDRVGAYRLVRVHDPDGPLPAAGQFAMLACAERWGGGADGRPFLPRAFSIARLKDGEAQFLLEDVGPGTHRLAELLAGEELRLLGPLGSCFTEPRAGTRPVLVGGGIGIAPLVLWQDQLGERPATTLLGFRDRDHAAGAGLLRDARVATDDGSAGHHGPVTELLGAELERDPAATVYACGPPPMLEAVRALCAERGIGLELALEAGMACGFGACYGCVVPTRDGSYIRVCVDGPVVDGSRLERVAAPEGEPGRGRAAGRAAVGALTPERTPAARGQSTAARHGEVAL